MNIAPQPVAKLLGVVRGDQEPVKKIPVIDHVVAPEKQNTATSNQERPSSFWARIIAALFKG